MKRHFAYAKYVLLHKFWVLVEGVKLKVPLSVLLLHDLDKFNPWIWMAYARHFYSAEGKKQIVPVSEEFLSASDFHVENNQHHWQWWVVNKGSSYERACRMSMVPTREMVADWKAMSRVFGGDAGEWYRTNTAMKLHPETRKMVEELLFAKRIVR